MSADTVTVLTSLSLPLAKTIVRTDAGGETRTRQLVKFYRGEELEVCDIRTLAAVLEKASADPHKCVVRGAIAPGVDRERMLRRKYPKDGEPETLVERPRVWLLVDVDKLALPVGFDPFADPVETVRWVRSKMPACFHAATCWYQFTGSAGIKPGLHIRLGFWLDRPLGEAELKRWLAQKVAEPGKSAKTWFREYPVDPAVFATAQPIYVATPIIEAGAQDPLDGRCARSGVVDGAAEIVIVPSIEARPVERAKAAKASTGGAGATFAECLAAIGDHDGGNGCYEALKYCIAVWWRRYGSGARADKLKRLLIDRVAAAEWDSAVHPVAYREQKLEGLDSLIDFVRGQQRASEQAEEERRARASCPWPDPGIPLAQAELPLRASIARFFDEAIPEALAKRNAYEAAIDAHRRATEHSAVLDFGQSDVDDFFLPIDEPEPPAYAQWGVKITPGAGKTHAAIEQLVDHVTATDRTVVFAVPTHSKAEEVEGDINRVAGGAIAATWRGIDREDPETPGMPMCRRASVVKAVVKSSGSINDVCGSAARGFCPFRRTCGYRRQAERLPKVWVVTHATLATKPQGAMKEAVALIVDEALTLGNAREDDMPLADLSAARKMDAQIEGWLRRARGALGQVPPGAYVPRAPFEAEGFTADTCAAISRSEAFSFVRVAGAFEPANDDETIEAKIEAAGVVNGEVRIRQAFWRNLGDLLAGPEPTSARMRLSMSEEAAIRITTPARPHPDWLKRPVLHLDATLEEAVVAAWLPGFELIADIRVERGEGVTVHQVVDQVVSYGRVVPGAGGDKSAEKRSAQENNAQRIMRAIEVKAAADRRAGGKTSAIAPKSLEEYMEETWRSWGTRPHNLLLDHYGNIRGLNTFEDCLREILISRWQPPAREIEQAVRREFGRHPSTAIGIDYYPNRIAALRTGGNSIIMVEQAYHPDGRADTLLRQTRDAELTQALHRARPVRRSKDRPLVIEIVAGIPADITVDSTGTLDEWLEASPAEVLLARGIWPLSWEDKQLVLRDLFATADAARRGFSRDRTGLELRRWLDGRLRGKSGQSPYKESLIRGLPAFEAAAGWPIYRYKAVGANRAHTVAVDPALHPAAREAWAARLGRPLELFEAVDRPNAVEEAETCPPPVVRLAKAPSIVSDILGTDRRDPAAPPFPVAPLHLRTRIGTVRHWPHADAGKPLLAIVRAPVTPEPLLTVEAICDHLGISRFALKNHMGKSRFRKLIGADRERAAVQWMTLKVGREQFISAVRALAERMRQAERA